VAAVALDDGVVTVQVARAGSATVSRWWHAAIAAVIVASLVIQLVLILSGGADANTGETGESIGVGVRLWRLFSFFTIESNLIVLAAALALPLHSGHGAGLVGCSPVPPPAARPAMRRPPPRRT
jgi:hypothetical protein